MDEQRRVALREKRRLNERSEYRTKIKSEEKVKNQRSELLGDRYHDSLEKDSNHLSNAIRVAESTQVLGADTVVKLKAQTGRFCILYHMLNIW